MVLPFFLTHTMRETQQQNLMAVCTSQNEEKHKRQNEVVEHACAHGNAGGNRERIE